MPFFIIYAIKNDTVRATLLWRVWIVGLLIPLVVVLLRVGQSIVIGCALGWSARQALNEPPINVTSIYLIFTSSAFAIVRLVNLLPGRSCVLCGAGRRLYYCCSHTQTHTHTHTYSGAHCSHWTVCYI